MHPIWEKAPGDFPHFFPALQERTVTDAGTEAYLAPEATLKEGSASRSVLHFKTLGWWFLIIGDDCKLPMCYMGIIS